VTHQLRVSGTAHLVGRADRALTDKRKQLVADGGRRDRGRGPRGTPDLDVPRAYVSVVYREGGGRAPQEVNDHVVAAGRCGGQAAVDGLVICEVDDRVGPAVSGLLEGLSAGGSDDPAGAQDPSGLQRQLARRAACSQDQHRFPGLEVSTVVERHPSDQSSQLQSSGEAEVKGDRNREAGRIRDRHQLG
jgi:hypothetical protein